MPANSYDAIVVGSGMSGGWAAKELAERGLRTIVLEAGRDIDPAVDYIEHKPIYEFKFRGLGDRRHARSRQFIQSQCGPYEEQTKHFFVDDVDNPYSFDPAKPFLWIRSTLRPWLRSHRSRSSRRCLLSHPRSSGVSHVASSGLSVR
jgi:glucoside 3-dehydrogenase (cytochrome c) catalytic subunit